MEELADESINIVVTSPPYPMVEMWDDIFAMQNNAIACNLADNPSVSFDLMHGILNNIWRECYRVLSEGGFLCINIGDATRTINGNSNCSITMRRYRYIAEVLVLRNFHASFGGSKQMPQISLWEVVCFPVVLMSPSNTNIY